MTDDIKAALRDMGFGPPLKMEALGGGVSCDVFLVDLADRRICVKRALPKLRVAADWHAPAERAEAEVAWIELVAGLDPRWVPKVLGEDKTRHLFAMEYLPYPLWKTELADGRIDIAFAAEVGAALAHIHAVRGVAKRFANGPQFHALRIEPYLLHTAEHHPGVAPRIRAIAQGVEESRIALMHGDVSPKNILCGPDSPVFLDAECACWGDPAFDLAFCLNHLLLKSIWHPRDAAALHASFEALKTAYAPDAALDRRAAALLAAFLLARIDGKSPVEYLTDEAKKDFVRAQAKAFLSEEALSLDALASLWMQALSAWLAPQSGPTIAKA
jgi:aminoglycoside phosphotransferase (APT) family kinase protein